MSLVRDSLCFTAGAATGILAYSLIKKYGSVGGVCAKATKEFMKMDTNKDGIVSLPEFQLAMQQALGDAYEEWEPAMERLWATITEAYYSLDADGDGSVSASEVALAIKKVLGRAYNNAEKLAQPYIMSSSTIVDAAIRNYKSMDNDKDGAVSLEEFLEGMKAHFGSAWSDFLEEKSTQLHAIIQEADTNKDGEMDLAEFLQYVQDQCAAQFNAVFQG